ncbi:Branched chain amino acid ABC transporter substrate-binding protein [Microbacterium sp. C448]|uniref:ABC transporter substrate-binding protein n=1 Tax=Microbacterium TaxID=33882 RepID=UPI0003DE4709|nr:MULTISPECIES: ABC transporter substrate-binding protein [Microbacterium]CDK00325.1 Branched chain amino acid ABC transporter substrate-binding protein [Microbacterium sp. C448]
MSSFHRTAALGVVAVLALGLAACSTGGETPEGQAAEPVTFGVALPQTGDQAQYGEYFEQGFELALSELNDAGGIDGRPVELVYEDTQADPAQAPAVAQKFVDDESILAVLGDFGTPASAAASPIYQAAGLVQFAFSASASTVTDPGDFIFATWVSQEYEAPRLAEFAAEQGSTAAVFYHDTDWGVNTHGFFSEGAEEAGLDEVYTTGYNPEGTDFRPLLLAASDADPEVIVLISYAADGALIASQARELGIDVPIVGISSIYNQQFIELAGDAAEGVQTLSYFTPENPDEAVQQFITDFAAEYDVETPSDYAIRAYDAFNVVAAAATDAAEAGELTRQSLRDALDEGEDFPTILYGPITFADNRRIVDADQYPLVIRDGAFQLAD